MSTQLTNPSRKDCSTSGTMLQTGGFDMRTVTLGGIGDLVFTIYKFGEIGDIVDAGD
jgi:hypothetical protein